MTPLERAVRALEDEMQRQHREDWLSHFVPRNEGSDWITVDGNVDLTPLARAVLEAIRAPSEAMVAESHTTQGEHWFATDEFAAEYVREDWARMIDAALAE